MADVALSGNDSVTLQNRVFSDFADGDYVMLTFPEAIATVKTGKNQNTVFAQKPSGNNAEAKFRIIRGSADDKFLNALLLQQQANFPGTILLSGQFVKVIGNGKGQIAADTYILSKGVFEKLNEGKSNADGEPTQSVVEYSMKFASAQRVLT